MKWCRTLLLVNSGELARSDDWKVLHESYVRAIQSLDFPEGSGTLTLRKRWKNPDSGKYARNGVSYLKNRFLQQMTGIEGWKAEGQTGIQRLGREANLTMYPEFQSHSEQVASKFGDFDFLTKTSSGFRAAIEWETGNISSSHRSLNKLVIALSESAIDAGVLILPTRELYEHLTDRVGNIREISPYLSFWQNACDQETPKILAITVVEHDFLTDDPSHPFLKLRNDGRAKEGRENIKKLVESAKAARRKAT